MNSSMSAPSGEAMDRIIERSSRWPRWAVVVGVMALLGGAGFYFFSSDGERSRAVAGSHITIGEVTRGQFDDVIPVRGRVTPLRTTYVDTASGGHVEQILVEDGALVERGQMVVE